MADNITQLRPYTTTGQQEEWGGFLASDITERPKPREWIVDALVPRKCVTLLAGGPKTGKSLLLMQMLASVALGMPWIGCHTEPARALGLFLEDDKDELARRLWNISGAYHEDLERLYDLELNPREQLSTKIFRFPRGEDTPVLTPFGQRLWETVDVKGYQLIGLDTATLIFGGRVIIDIERVTNCLRELTNLAVRHNAAVVISAHTKKDQPEGFAGPNAWLGTVRAAMNLRIAMDDVAREPIRGQRILQNLGGNYAEWDPITLYWREGVWEPGLCEAKPLPRPKTSQERIEFNYRVLAYLAKMVSRGTPVMLDDVDDRSLIKRVRRAQRSQGLGAAAYNDIAAAQEWALDQGLAVLVKLGGKCHIRPRDARYEDEEPWRA